MKQIKLILFATLATVLQCYSQETSADKKDIRTLIETYSKSVLEKRQTLFSN